eukprot:Gb_37711 [translate_table: standard]
MNRTLLERSRSMLSGASLEKKFWAEAVMTSCYLINRSPSSSLGDKTPHEVWCDSPMEDDGYKVEVVDFFSSKDKENKLDTTSQAYICNVYSKNVKAYRLFDPLTRRIIICKDVIFYESDIIGDKKLLDVPILVKEESIVTNDEVSMQDPQDAVQMDVCTTFLNGTIDEEVYVQQPLGFEEISSEGKVYKLKKALYGLKQAP